MKTTNSCIISFGGYGNNLMVDAVTAAKMLPLLENALIVDDSWTGAESVLVRKKAAVKIEMGTMTTVTEEEFETLREAAKAKKAATTPEE